LIALHTASEGISFAKALEVESATFYENLAKRFPTGGEAFLAFAKENRKNVLEVERTYYGVITDAIEGGYCFDLEPNVYAINVEMSVKTSFEEALAAALSLEEKIIGFYSDAAVQSKPLMADVPRAFLMIVKKRKKRLPILNLLLAKKEV